MLALEGKAESPEAALKPMAEKILEQALAGDVASFREIADRLDGKPGQQVQLQGDADNPLVATIKRVIVDPDQKGE